MGSNGRVQVFHVILPEYTGLNIDLFATRLIHKPDVYCSWKPDLGWTFVDAFSFNCKAYNFYAFPPFSLIPAWSTSWWLYALKITEKIIRENAVEQKKKKPGLRANQPSDNWAQLYKYPWILYPDKKLLQHPGHQEPHLLWKTLQFMIYPVSR